MSRPILRIWREAPWLGLGFLAALILTLLFAVRFFVSWLYWSDPEHLQQPLAGWMTPGYVARSWQVPRSLVADVLDLSPGTERPGTLSDLARIRGVPLETLVDDLAVAIAAYRGAKPPNPQP